MREDGGADRGLEVLPALVEAPGETKCTLQEGDGAFDAGPEALRCTEGQAMLATRFRLAAPTLLSDRHDVDRVAKAAGLVDALVEAFVRGEFAWRRTEVA